MTTRARQLAAEEGFIRLSGGRAQCGRLLDQWLCHCLDAGWPLVALLAHADAAGNLNFRLVCALHRPWWLSRRLRGAIERAAGYIEPGRSRSFEWCDDEQSELEQKAHALVELFRGYRLEEDNPFDQPSPLADGWARCVYNEAMEHVLELDGRYVIRENAYMPGHVEVWRHNQMPWSFIHGDRFELLHE